MILSVHHVWSTFAVMQRVARVCQWQLILALGLIVVNWKRVYCKPYETHQLDSAVFYCFFLYPEINIHWEPIIFCKMTQQSNTSNNSSFIARQCFLDIWSYFCTTVFYKNTAVVDMGDRWATMDTAWKVRAALHLFVGWGAGSPSNTMWPGPRPTSVPSGIFIYPAVWPQQTWAENWGLCPFLGAGSQPNIM